MGHLASELGIQLDIDTAARAHIAAEGYEPAFGARPLKRAIQRCLQDPLALYLLEEDLEEGAVVHVRVSDDGERLVFEVAEVAPPEPTLQRA